MLWIIPEEFLLRMKSHCPYNSPGVNSNSGTINKEYIIGTIALDDNGLVGAVRNGF